MAINVQNKNCNCGLNQIVSKSPWPIVAAIKRIIDSARALELIDFSLFKQIFKQYFIIKIKNTTKDISAKIPLSTAISNGTQYEPRASYPVFMYNP